MKKIIICLLAFNVFSLSLFAQADMFRMVPGAEAQLANLLNKPTMAKRAVATPIRKNWYTLETDTHVFTDEVSLAQVREIMTDIENQPVYLNGSRSKISTSIVSRGPEETLTDYVSITIVPVVKIQLKTPYRAITRALTDTDTKFVMDIRQIPQDSETNKKLQNLFAFRYIEEVTINGKKYIYVRIYSIMDLDVSIISKNTLENNAGPTNEEALGMIIKAAKTK